MLEFRDRRARETGIQLIVHRNEHALSEGANPFRLGLDRCCQLLKTQALKDALAQNGIDAAIGGARREEERSRAKERIFSIRDSHSQWDPKRQRTEVWNLYNCRLSRARPCASFPCPTGPSWTCGSTSGENGFPSSTCISPSRAPR